MPTSVVLNQIIKVVDMNVFSHASALLILAASGSAPPHTPNFCSQAFCLELQPMLHSGRRGFVEIDRGIVEIDGRSWMTFKYADLGKVSVIGPFPVTSTASNVSVNEAVDEITVISCFNKDDAATCGRYIITVTDNKVATKPLICSIISFWSSRPEANSPDVQLGERIDIGERLSEQCL